MGDETGRLRRAVSGLDADDGRFRAGMAVTGRAKRFGVCLKVTSLSTKTSSLTSLSSVSLAATDFEIAPALLLSSAVLALGLSDEPLS